MSTVADLLAAYDSQLRGAPAVLPPGEYAEADGPLLRIVGGHRGYVTGPRDLRGSGLDDLIARQRDFFAARGEAVEWKTRAHDLPEDLPARLLAAGFVPEEREAVLIGIAADLAAEPVLSEGITVRRTADPDDLHRIAVMQSRVWDEDLTWMGEDLIRRTAAGNAVYVAEAGGEIVSAARIDLREGPDFAGLWGGSTLEPWRGKGIYKALVAVRARLAVAQGLKYLQVDASPDSRPILERLGFVAVTTTTPYVWSPPTVE
jgi:GNAT superfamily N-acetyltransferase